MKAEASKQQNFPRDFSRKKSVSLKNTPWQKQGLLSKNVSAIFTPDFCVDFRKSIVETLKSTANYIYYYKKKLTGEKRSQMSQFYRFFGIFSRIHASQFLICCKARRVLSIFVFSGKSGDTNFLAFVMKHVLNVSREKESWN